MTLKDKRTIILAFARQYQKGRKREKTQLLDKIAKSTGYHRKYLARILQNPPKKRRIRRERKSAYLVVLPPLKKNYRDGGRISYCINLYMI